MYVTYAPCEDEMEDNFEKKPEDISIEQFDPLTGKLEAGDTLPAGEAIAAPKSKKTVYAAVGIGVALVAIVLICIISLVAKGKGFSGDKGKVLQAISNTVKEQPKLLEDLNLGLLSEIAKTKDYSITLDATAGYYKGAISYNEKAETKQFSGNVGMSFFQLDLLGEITPKLVKLQIPMVHDRILTYDYTAKKTGAIVDYIGEEYLDQVDILLKQQQETDKVQKSSDKIVKAMEKELNSLEVKKIGKKEFTVDGSLKSSNGYRMIIKKENVNKIFDVWEEMFKSYYSEEFITGAEAEDIMEEARLEIENMKEIYVDFYIYEKKLAAIILSDETEKDEHQVLFEGGTRRTENMKLIVVSEGDVESEVSLEGKTEGNVETIKIVVTEYGESSEVANITYDTKSGDFKLFLADSYSETELNGTIKTDKNQWQLSLHQTTEDSEFPEITVAITMKKGAVIKKMEGTEFDVGNASDEELQNVLNEYFGFLFGL